MPSQKSATAANAISNWGTVEANRSSSTSLSRFTSVSATWTIAVPGSTLTARAATRTRSPRSEEHTSELQSQSNLVCRLLLEKKKKLRQYITEHHWNLLRIIVSRPITEAV